MYLIFGYMHTKTPRQIMGLEASVYDVYVKGYRQATRARMHVGYMRFYIHILHPTPFNPLY